MNGKPSKEDNPIPSTSNHYLSCSSTNLSKVNSQWFLANAFELHSHQTWEEYLDQNEDEVKSSTSIRGRQKRREILQATYSYLTSFLLVWTCFENSRSGKFKYFPKWKFHDLKTITGSLKSLVKLCKDLKMLTNFIFYMYKNSMIILKS